MKVESLRHFTRLQCTSAPSTVSLLPTHAHAGQDFLCVGACWRLFPRSKFPQVSADLNAVGVNATLNMHRMLYWCPATRPQPDSLSISSQQSGRRAGVRGESLTPILLARRPCGSRTASGRHRPIFSTSTFHIEAMLCRVRWRTSPRVSVHCTSGSPSFSRSTTSSLSRLVTSLEPGLLPEEFCTAARHVVTQRTHGIAKCHITTPHSNSSVTATSASPSLRCSTSQFYRWTKRHRLRGCQRPSKVRPDITLDGMLALIGA